MWWWPAWLADCWCRFTLCLLYDFDHKRPGATENVWNLPVAKIFPLTYYKIIIYHQIRFIMKGWHSRRTYKNYANCLKIFQSPRPRDNRHLELLPFPARRSDIVLQLRAYSALLCSLSGVPLIRMSNDPFCSTARSCHRWMLSHLITREEQYFLPRFPFLCLGSF